MKPIGALVSSVGVGAGGRARVLFYDGDIVVESGRFWARRERFRVGYDAVGDVSYRAPGIAGRGSLVVYLRGRSDYHQCFQFVITRRNARAARRVRDHILRKLGA